MPGALDHLQRAASAIHEVAGAFSLERGRLLLDEAGLVFLLVFGVPYNTHAADVTRAMRLALAFLVACSGAPPLTPAPVPPRSPAPQPKPQSVAAAPA